ncbi:MAG: hypothetical protein ACI8U1_002435, partial [Rheinheimera aquimaris]
NFRSTLSALFTQRDATNRACFFSKMPVYLSAIERLDG